MRPAISCGPCLATCCLFVALAGVISPPAGGEMPSCPGDLDGDGTVGSLDLSLLVGYWGPCPESCLADLDGDAYVGAADMVLLINEWGVCPDDDDDDDDVDDDIGCPGSGEYQNFTTMFDDPALQARFPEWELEQAYNIWEGFLSFDRDPVYDPFDDDVVTPHDIVEFLDKHVPREFDGYIFLDWEYPVLAILNSGPSNPNYKLTIKNMILALDHVRSLRPHAKLGYYGLPTRMYSPLDQDADWYASMHALKADLFPYVDAVVVSVYDFYTGNPGLDNLQFGNLVRLGLELAEEKPVFVYTHHRYHYGSTNDSFETILDAEYIAHIYHKLNCVQYNGKYPAGAVAWGADRYTFEQCHLLDEHGNYINTGPDCIKARQVFELEMRPDETIEQFVARVNTRVYTNLAQTIGPVPSNSPVARLTASKKALIAPDEVTLSGVGSIDYDNFAIDGGDPDNNKGIPRCEFDPGDGSPVRVTDGKCTSVTHTYESPGVFEATLTAWDDEGQPSTATVQIRSYTCAGLDLDGNGVVDHLDMVALITLWGTCPPGPVCAGDLDGDGVVGISDLTLFLTLLNAC